MTTRTSSTITRCGLVSLAAVTAMVGCGSDDTVEAPTPSPGTDAPASTETGTISVRLAEVDGVFTEGFEVGLRFETPDGEVIDSVLWSDFVAGGGDPDIAAYYDSVLEQVVPAGEVVVLASVNVGIGPPPEVPDIDGVLRCRLVADVPADGDVEVIVTFSSEDDCLELGALIDEP